MLVYLEDDVALLGADGIGVLAGLQGEHGVFKYLGEAAVSVVEGAEVSAIGGRCAVTEGLGQLGEVTTGVEFGLDVVGLCLACGRFGGVVGVGAGGDENFAQLQAFRLDVILLVLLEVALSFAGSELNSAADFLAHDLLGDDLVADIGLEVLKGDALLLGGLFQVFQSLKVVLFADLVKALDEVSVSVDAQFFGLGEPELLVNEAAEEVLVSLRDLLHGETVLLGLVVGFLHGAVVVGLRNDLVIDVGDDIFNGYATIGTLRRGGMRLRRS